MSLTGRFGSTRTPPLPPALLAEIGLAHERVLELAARDRELHFVSDASGHVVVELRTLEGRLLRRISPALALDIINGADLDRALSAAMPACDSPPIPPAAA